MTDNQKITARPYLPDSERVLDGRKDMLAHMRTKTPSELLEACSNLLLLPSSFGPGAQSYSLLTLFKERLQADLIDGRPDFSSKQRGEVALLLQQGNRHLSIEQARYYVDAVCNLFSSVATKEPS